MVNVLAASLAELLAAVLPFTSKDRQIPALCAVRLEARGGYLVATATDRYRVGSARLKLDEDATWTALVDSSDVKSLIGDLKKLHGHASIDVTDRKITVDMLGSARTFATVEANYPKISTILVKALTQPMARTRAFDLDMKLLADFGVVAKASKTMLRAWLCDSGELMAVTCGDDFVGAIMLPRPGVPAEGADDRTRGAGWDELLAS